MNWYLFFSNLSWTILVCAAIAEAGWVAVKTWSFFEDLYNHGSAQKAITVGLLLAAVIFAAGLAYFGKSPVTLPENRLTVEGNQQ